MESAIYENRLVSFDKFTGTSLSSIPHLHKEMEMVFVHEGMVIAHADKTAVLLHKGDLFISFPNQIHYYEHCTAGKYDVLIATPDLVYDLKDMLKNVTPEENSFSVTDNNPIRFYWDELPTVYNEQKRFAVAGYLNLLFSEIMRHITLTEAVSSGEAVLKELLRYCEVNYAGILSLDAVAEDLHVSKYYLSRLLNRKLHLNFNEYINSLRISRACRLLETTNKRTADISENVGFGSIRSFNRAFQHIMHITPVEYRQRHMLNTKNVNN